MARTIAPNEPDAGKRGVEIILIDATGFPLAIDKTGAQPQITVDGGTLTSTGVGVLDRVSGNIYTMTLTQDVLVEGAVIRSYFNDSDTGECFGETVEVQSASTQGELAAAEAAILTAVGALTPGGAGTFKVTLTFRDQDGNPVRNLPVTLGTTTRETG